MPDSALMKAIEALDYRVTTGDVAAKAGLNIRQAERGLLALASQAGGHLQVAETGEIAYLFPKNFRAVLRNNSLKLKLQELWQRIWGVLFYLIRISFGILLITSLIIIVMAIFALMIISTQGRDRNDRGGGTQIFIFPSFWLRGSMFGIFRTDYYRRRRSWQTDWDYQNRRPASSPDGSANRMNFLEAVFSFLFGDGDPNIDLEERRWQQIAGVIRNNHGAVVAEQIAPHLDLSEHDLENDTGEDYMLPVLTRFYGRPEVSPDGNIIYHFPELQVMAEQRGRQYVPDFLKEREWPFSLAGSQQLIWAGALGTFNLIGAIFLGVMLMDQELTGTPLGLGGTINAIDIGYVALLLYAVAFVAIPTIRYFWLKRNNARIESRNQNRLSLSSRLDHATEELQQKIGYAQQFAAETVVSPEDLAYTTETDLTEQDALNSSKIDEEWRRRLEGRM